MDEMESSRVDILGMCEIRKKGCREIHLNNDYGLIYSGVPADLRTKNEVDITMKENIFAKVEDWEPISSRIIKVYMDLSI